MTRTDIDQVIKGYDLPDGDILSPPMTALEWSFHEGWIDGMQVLLEFGADPNVRASEFSLYSCPFFSNKYSECKKSKKKEIQLLVENGLKISVDDLNSFENLIPNFHVFHVARADYEYMISVADDWIVKEHAEEVKDKFEILEIRKEESVLISNLIEELNNIKIKEERDRNERSTSQAIYLSGFVGRGGKVCRKGDLIFNRHTGGLVSNGLLGSVSVPGEVIASFEDSNSGNGKVKIRIINWATEGRNLSSSTYPLMDGINVIPGVIYWDDAINWYPCR